MVLDTLLNPIFSPLLVLPPLLSILLISFLISLIITVIYKYMTDQTMMKDLKTRQKDLQKKMRANKGDPKKLSTIQKEAMDLNMKYMMQSFKPTLITFLPIIIIFGWLQGHLAYEPIMPGEQFDVLLQFAPGTEGNVQATFPDGVLVVGDAVKTINSPSGSVKFTFSADVGDYLLVFNHDGAVYDKELTVSTQRQYAEPIKTFKTGALQQVTIENNKLIALNILGKEDGKWYQGTLGWLGTYILFSVIFSMGLRKLLKIY